MTKPEGESVPTFDEVMKFAVEADLYGKVSISKFYDYYHKQGFLWKGVVMDWKSKLNEWAQTQRSAVVPTAREREAYKRARPRLISVAGYPPMTENDYFDFLNDLIARNAI